MPECKETDGCSVADRQFDEFMAVWEDCGRQYRFSLSDGEIVNIQLLPRSFILNPAALEELAFLSQQASHGTASNDDLNRFINILTILIHQSLRVVVDGHTSLRRRMQSVSTRLGGERFRYGAIALFHQILCGAAIVGAPSIPKRDVDYDDVDDMSSSSDEDSGVFETEGWKERLRPKTARPGRYTDPKAQVLPPGLNKERAASNDELRPTRTGGSSTRWEGMRAAIVSSRDHYASFSSRPDTSTYNMTWELYPKTLHHGQ
eukprot:Blabericola_migrator_1__3088@NODE_18_length_22925_cov_118_464826_g15_i0_p11_GENE_NODE_18_length_22925_cov_118_464826_g15_i0NODE_18_length_22925_cov_118_464826_g15_i0_p11_ORF_typecomplete_len261_score21_89DUF3944/PF13099_6/0_35_NODE_18_length_22925_cov_118_464826_g15_i02128322065